MHIRLIETGYKPRRLSFDIDGPLEVVARRIIAQAMNHNFEQIAAVKFTKFDAVLYSESGTVFTQLKDSAAHDLREKLALLYPELI